MSRKIAVGFVIYGADDKFLDRLQQVVAQGFDVFIFDNSPWKPGVRDYAVTQDRVSYFTVGKNTGLGFGMSSVCAQAYYARNFALIFFDQDTIFSPETLEFIENYYLSNPNLPITYSAVVFSSRGNAGNNTPGHFRDVELAINSGSLFFLENLRSLGWHNEKYFVDCVDYEFCLKSQIAGLKIGAYLCTPGLDHSTEQPDKQYKIFGTLRSLRAYPLFRIIDTLKASVRLIVTAGVLGRFRFAIRIGRLLVIYVVIQIIARSVSPVSNR